VTTKLNAVTIGQNRYCGPAVLSILTGKSTDECARVITSINGNYRVEGVKLTDLLSAAERLGFDWENVNPMINLYTTLISLVNRDGIYIVAVASHFVCIEVADRKIFFCDNHTKEPMPAASSARLLQPVKAVCKVTKRREPVLLKAQYKADRHLGQCYGVGVDLVITQHFTYDIEKWNKVVTVACLKFKSEQEMEEFIEELTSD
jgi:hypothetical protein